MALATIGAVEAVEVDGVVLAVREVQVVVVAEVLPVVIRQAAEQVDIILEAGEQLVLTLMEEMLVQILGVAAVVVLMRIV